MSVLNRTLYPAKLRPTLTSSTTYVTFPDCISFFNYLYSLGVLISLDSVAGTEIVYRLPSMSSTSVSISAVTKYVLPNSRLVMLESGLFISYTGTCLACNASSSSLGLSKDSYFLPAYTFIISCDGVSTDSTPGIFCLIPLLVKKADIVENILR
nr:MAG TPA: hypothetical protein [Caudoviricetes sp.]